MDYRSDVLQERVQFPVWTQLVCWYWLPRILASKVALKLLVLSHIIMDIFPLQVVIALHRINTSGIELHMYPQGWVKTIKIVNI